MNGADYERELKGILEDAGYFVTRSAGSHASDLTVVNKKTGSVMILEVKSFTGTAFSVRRKAEDLQQWREIMRMVDEMPAVAIRYALRRKRENGDPWRLIDPALLEKPYHWDGELNILYRGSSAHS